MTMYKNSLGSFANEKFTDSYEQMTSEEVEVYKKYGPDGFVVDELGCRVKSDLANVLTLDRKRLNSLSLTKREIFLALYKDKGITPETLRSQITDPGTLIEFDYAEKYYRGNPLIDLIGEKLGYTSDELDYLFEHRELESNKESTQEG